MTEFNTLYKNCDPIAVIGLACRFPLAPDSETFWAHLQQGVECTAPIGRDELLAAGLSPEHIDTEYFVSQAAVLEEAEQFDADLFGYSRQEAELLDPQQRLFLQTVWHALEHGGYAPRHISQKTGIFGSTRVSTWPSWSQFSMTDVGRVKGLQALLSNDKDYLATRVAYKLNLTGPALTVQTACSSSLVAAHMACESLRAGECDMAVAGGVAVSFPQNGGYIYQPGMIFSPDGHCRPFDSQAEGTYAGNGVGAIVLKRLSDALRDDDPIIAVLRGSTINNDGNDKVGFTAPSVQGQRHAIVEAMHLADVCADDIGMIEAHGTGTPLGDPIEVEALRGAFEQQGSTTGICYLGSVKSNMGHLDTAAGIASLIKTILSVKHGHIPPTINVRQINPMLRLEEGPFRLALTGQTWNNPLRTAGVSSFGIGGTNCHMVVQSFPETLRQTQPETKMQAPPPLLLSAASPSSLLNLAKRYAAALNKAPEQRNSLAYTALHGRDLSLPYRLATPLTLDSAAALEAFSQNIPTADLYQGETRAEGKLVWQFSGQGCQWPGMGKTLYATSSAFAKVLDLCCEACDGELKHPLKSVMFGEYGNLLAQTDYAQPAIVAFEIAMAAHWQSLGLQPDFALGHSVGEFSAAVVAGVYPLETVMPLVAVRGRLMHSCAEGGAMLAVFADEQQVRPLTFALKLDIAVWNGPRHIVWSGHEEDIETLAERLEQQQIHHQRLAVACAAHSVMLDPILDEFTRHCTVLVPEQGRFPLISTLTGECITPSQLAEPTYWRRHLRLPVRYYQAIDVTRQLGSTTFIEIGPDAPLTGIGKRQSQPHEFWIASMSRKEAGNAPLQAALMQLYCVGAPLDWSQCLPLIGRRCHAPLYPFDEQRYDFSLPTPKSVPVAVPNCDLNSLLISVEPESDSAILLALYVDNLVHQCCGADIEHGVTAAEVIRSGRLQPGYRSLLDHLLSVCVVLGYYQYLDNQPGHYQRRVRLPYSQRRALETRLLQDYPDLIRTGEHLFALLCGRRDLPKLTQVTLPVGKTRLPAPQAAPGTQYLTRWLVTPPMTETSPARAYAVEPSDLDVAIQASWQRAGLNIQSTAQHRLLWLSGHDVRTLCAQVIDALTLDDPRPLTVISCNAMPESWLKTETINPAQYAVWSLLRVACEEYPQRFAGAVDMGHAENGSDLMLALAYQNEKHRWLRVRNGTVSIPQIVPISADERLLTSPLKISAQGWHIVTGGMGGIGQIAIRWLLTQGAKHVAVLAPRSHQDWEKTLSELQQAHQAELRWLECDITDRPKVLDALQSLSHDGGIAGAIHTAGIADHTRIDELTSERLSQVLAIKKDGADTLLEGLQQHEGRYLLLFASAAAMLGAAGQAAYAVANASLESLALTAPKGLTVKTLSWGVWGGVGMAQDSRLVAHLASEGMLPFSVAEGLWHLNQSLSCAAPCYLAMRLNQTHSAILRRLGQPILPPMPATSLPQEVSPEAAPLEDEGQRQEWLRQRIAAQLRLNNPTQMDARQDLLQLGLDSLLFLELNADIHQQFGFRLTAEAAYRNMSLAGLSALISDEIMKQQPTAAFIAPIDQEHRYDPFPLTPIQHAYWIGRTHAIDYGGVACHVLFEWDQDLNRFDLPRFEQAWNALILRHDMLRMVVDGDGQQRVLPDVPYYRFERHNLCSMDEHQRQQELETRRQTLSYHVPPTHIWPLFDVSVSLLPDDRCRLHLNLDLLQFDVQSFRIMMDDLERAYRQQSLPPQAFTFRDYVMAEQAQRETPIWRDAWSFWHDRLADLPPAPRLPLHPEQSQRQQPQFTTYTGQLSSDNWQVLKQQWQRWGVTPSAGLLTLFAHALEWYCRHPQFTLNLTFFNRQPFHPDVQNVIGDFTSVLLMPFNLHTTDNLRDSMELTQSLLWQNLGHSMVNGVELLRELSRQTSQSGTPGRQPLTPVVFTSMLGMAQEGVAIEQSITQLLGDPVFVLSQTPQVWLDHQVMEVDGGLVFNWYCMDDILAPGVIDSLFTGYCARLEQLCQAPSTMEQCNPFVPPEGHSRYRFFPQCPTLRQIECELSALPEIRLAEVQPLTGEDGNSYHLWLVAEDNLPLMLMPPPELQINKLPLPSRDEQQEFTQSWHYIEALSLFGLGQTLRRHNLFSDPQQAVTHADIAERLKLAPQFQRLLGQWLALLVKKAWLTETPAGYCCLNPFTAMQPPKPMLAMRPWCQHISHYVESCIEQHDALLSGQRNALELLFADHQTTASLYSDNPALSCLNRTVAELVHQLSQNIENFTLLEVGAGIGATSAEVLIRCQHDLSAYHFSDISPLFLSDARNKLAPYAAVLHFKLFDINQPLDFRQHPEQGYDVILAVNVLHDAIHLERSLKRLARLLKPGGWLLLIEATEQESAMQLATVGFIEGINAYQDSRQTDDSAMLNLAGWQSQLAQAGYEIQLEWPPAGSVELHQQLILARPRFNSRLNLAELATQLPELPFSLELHQQERLPLVVSSPSQAAMVPIQEPQPSASMSEQSQAAEVDVVALWQSLLSQPIQRHSDFFQCGGDSLIATRMIVQLRRQGYEHADLQQLFSYPQLSQFCQTLFPETVEGNAVTAVETEQPFPLTDLQYAYWLGESELFQYGNGIAHFYAELAIEDCDLERFTIAWNRVVARHSQLRGYVNDEGFYCLQPNVPPYLPTVTDCRSMKLAERNELLANARHRLRTQGVPSQSWPLFALNLYQTDERTTLLHLTVDLLLADGKSLTILLQDLQRWYISPEWQPEPVTLSIGNYIRALEVEKQGTVWEQSRRYWLNRLPTLPDAPALPLREYRVDSLDQRCLSGHITADQWQNLTLRAREIKASPSQVLLSLFACTLSLWSSSQHFTINVLHGNRLLLSEHCDSLVGNLSTTSLLEVDLRGISGFMAVVERLQRQWLADLQHALFDGQQVLREKNQQRRNLNAGMPIVFNDTVGVTDKRPQGLGTLSLFGAQTPHVYLDCMLIAGNNGGVDIQWAILPELFQPGVIEDMFAYFTAGIATLLEPGYRWDAPLPHLQLKPDPIAIEHVSTADTRCSNLTLCSLIRATVARYPQRIALLSAERQFDYQTLWLHAVNLATHLRNQSDDGAQLIAVVMDKGWEQVIAVLAIQLAGKAYLPIDATYPQRRIQTLLHEGKVSWLLTQPRHAATLAQVNDISILTIDEALLAKLPTGNDDTTQVQPDDLAYVIFTSGSTGKPKGVAIDHRGAVNTLLDVNQRIGLNEQDRVLGISELTFDLSVYDIFGTLSSGACLVIPAPGDNRQPDRMLAWVEQQGITLWNSVPAFVQMLEEHAQERPNSLDSLRWVMMSGDWIPVALPDKLRLLHPTLNILSLGGATEASIWSVCYLIEQVSPAWNSIPYGKALDNQALYLLNADLAPCPFWVVGDLFIGGQGLARGYWNDEEKTRHAFITHPLSGERLYRTGDLARRLPDGNLEFLGRTDRQVKIHGHRIELGEIEQHLGEHPAIRQALVNLQTAPSGTHQLQAYLLLNEGALTPDKLLPALRHWLQQSLPGWMCPQTFAIIDALPISDNGKVDRNALSSIAVIIPSVSAPEKAASPLEQRLSDLWKDTLALDTLNITDSFFALGGDSLAAVRLIVKINRAFNRQYSLNLLQSCETIRSLANFIEHDQGDVAGLISLNQADATLPILFVIHPIGGHLLSYRQLSASLEDTFQLMGLAFTEQDLHGAEPSVPALASSYIQRIKARQPVGPYRIAGWSFGGLVAYEMSHQLRQAGEVVEHCILIDSFAPLVRDGLVLDDTLSHRYFLQDWQGHFPDLTLNKSIVETDTETFLSQLQCALQQSDHEENMLASLYLVWRYNLTALLAYQPPLTDQKFWLIKAEHLRTGFMDYLSPEITTDSTLGWHSFGNVNITVLPGDHYSLFTLPHVSALAHCLKNILQKPIPPTSTSKTSKEEA